MPHRASHSRRLARQAEAQHALGPLFETLHSPSDTADGHSLQPAHTAPPPPSSVGLLEQLSERQRAEQQATTSARTAAQPHPPPEPPPTILPETVEDPKRVLVHALQNDLSRMSVLLERLDELLSA